MAVFNPGSGQAPSVSSEHLPRVTRLHAFLPEVFAYDHRNSGRSTIKDNCEQSSHVDSMWFPGLFVPASPG